MTTATLRATTDATFAADIAQGLVLVDFWAPWCGPCRMIAPVLERLADQYAGKVKIVKLNVDENNHTAQKFKVMSIPTLLLFKNGSLVETTVGALPENKLQALLDKHI